MHGSLHAHAHTHTVSEVSPVCGLHARHLWRRGEAFHCVTFQCSAFSNGDVTQTWSQLFICCVILETRHKYRTMHWTKGSWSDEARGLDWDDWVHLGNTWYQNASWDEGESSFATQVELVPPTVPKHRCRPFHGFSLPQSNVEPLSTYLDASHLPCKRLLQLLSKI